MKPANPCIVKKYDFTHFSFAIEEFPRDSPKIVTFDVIKTADWIIDLGPEGGVRGGEIVAEGTPEQVVKAERSFTGRYLAPLLAR